jgi:hypothetical protein
MTAAEAISDPANRVWGIYQPVQFWEFYKVAQAAGGGLQVGPEIVIDSPANRAALDYLVGKIEAGVMPTDAQMSGMANEDLFQAGQLGMLVSGIWMFDRFSQADFAGTSSSSPAASAAPPTSSPTPPWSPRSPTSPTPPTPGPLPRGQPRGRPRPHREQLGAPRAVAVERRGPEPLPRARRSRQPRGRLRLPGLRRHPAGRRPPARAAGRDQPGARGRPPRHQDGRRGPGVRPAARRVAARRLTHPMCRARASAPGRAPRCPP